MRAAFPIAILAALSAPLAAQPRAPDWRVAATDAAGEQGEDVGASVAYIDLNSVLWQGENVDFTMEVRFRNQRNAGGANGLRAQMRADCSGMRWGSVSTTSYRGTTALGSSGATALTEAREGTNGREIVSAVCTGRYLSDSIADPIAHARQLLGGD